LCDWCIILLGIWSLWFSGSSYCDKNYELPARVQGLSSSIICRIACGRWHCIALAKSHSLFVWGRNHAGQLGLGFLSRSCASPAIILLEPQNKKKSLAVCDVAAGKQASLLGERCLSAMLVLHYKFVRGSTHYSDDHSSRWWGI